MFKGEHAELWERFVISIFWFEYFLTTDILTSTHFIKPWVVSMFKMFNHLKGSTQKGIYLTSLFRGNRCISQHLPRAIAVKYYKCATLGTEVGRCCHRLISVHVLPISCWCHQTETFSALLSLCARNSPVSGEFPAQRAVTRSFNVFYDLRLNKWLSKQSWGCWFETPSRPLWHHCND